MLREWELNGDIRIPGNGILVLNLNEVKSVRKA